DRLECAKTLYGPPAAEKLLFMVFQQKAERYAAKLKGETLAERVRALARLRDAEGCMADFDETDGALRIIEHHSPILDLLRAFPIVARLESEMFQRILKAPVQRDEDSVSGLYRCTFAIVG